MSARPVKISNPDIDAGVAVKDYADAVIAGKVVAGPSIQAAARRHLDDLKRSRRKSFPYRFDLEKAGKIINFYPALLTLRSGPTEGEPFHLLEWQKFMVGSLMGWVKKESNTRRFRSAYVQSSKGSGKSPLSAGLAIWMAACDGENSPEIYIAAKNFRQCGVLFKDMIAAIEASPVLSSLFKVYGGAEPSRAYIEREGFGIGEIHRLANDSSGGSVSGFRPSAILADEIGEWQTSSQLDLLRRGSKQREQPLFVAITNAGSGEDSVAWPYYQHAMEVLKGKVADETLFAMIFDMHDDDDPWEDESVWEKANPSLSAGLPGYPYIRSEVNRARAVPTERNMVKRMHWNEWTGDSAEFFVSPEIIESCFVPKFDDKDLENKMLIIGMDLSMRLDLTAGVCLWRGEEDGKDVYFVRSMFWIPDENLVQRSQVEKTPYDVWKDAGHIVAVDGNTIDMEYPASWIRTAQQSWKLRGVAYDSWRADSLQVEMKAAGMDFYLPDRDGFKRSSAAIPMWAHPQTFYKARQGKALKDDAMTNGLSEPLWMPGSIEAAELAMVEGRLKIEENPVMRNHLLGVKCSIDDNGGRRFTKKKSTGKIDGAVSLVMAVGLASKLPLEEAVRGPLVHVI